MTWKALGSSSSTGESSGVTAGQTYCGLLAVHAKCGLVVKKVIKASPGRWMANQKSSNVKSEILLNFRTKPLVFVGIMLVSSQKPTDVYIAGSNVCNMISDSSTFVQPSQPL